MSAPGRIRTRDPLLRRHRRSIALCRLVWLNDSSSCTDVNWLWPGVAWRLRPLAPSLTPRSFRLRSCSNERKSIGRLVRLSRHQVGRGVSCLTDGEGHLLLETGYGVA
jgi:hypothetical protein